MPDTSKLRVLVVDDSEDIRKLISFLLESMGCEVVGEAENGMEAVDLFKKKRPDLVLLDILMPVMNGLEALKKLVKIDRNVAVVMLTDVANNLVAEDCILVGARDYLRKDLAPEEMKKRLAEEVAKIID